jgi:hypothetical protein
MVEPLKTKQPRYTEGGKDLIDTWWEDYPPEIARVLMWEQMRKYKTRLGKKDEIVKEVRKIADYAARWLEKEGEI